MGYKHCIEKHWIENNFDTDDDNAPKASAAVLEACSSPIQSSVVAPTGTTALVIEIDVAPSISDLAPTPSAWIFFLVKPCNCALVINKIQL